MSFYTTIITYISSYYDCVIELHHNKFTLNLWNGVNQWMLFNIHLSLELDEGIMVKSLTWRYDGNGVCLGLSNGQCITCFIENDKKEIQEIHENSILNIKWNIDITDTNNDNSNDNDDGDHQQKNDKYSHYHQHYDKNNVDTSNSDDCDLSDIN